MSRQTVRWIGIALVAAMVATVGVGLVSGSPGPTETGSRPGEDANGAERASRAAAAVLDGPHVVVELCSGVVCPPLDDAGRQAIIAELEDDPRIASTRLVTAEQAYQLFLERFGDQPEMVEQVDPADVPPRIEIDLYDPSLLPEVARAYEDHDGVASVYDPRAVGP